MQFAVNQAGGQLWAGPFPGEGGGGGGGEWEGEAERKW